MDGLSSSELLELIYRDTVAEGILDDAPNASPPAVPVDADGGGPAEPPPVVAATGVGDGFDSRGGTVLDLANSFLTALPDGAFDLVLLDTLIISNNLLADLPDAVSKLTALTSLAANFNELVAVTEHIGDLHALRELSLAFNSGLTALPARLPELTQLRRLDLRGCGFEDVPAQILALHALEDLSVGDNAITRLPDGLGDLTQLRRLDAGDNALAVFPSCVSRLVQLERLLIHGNALDALDAAALSALTSLELLDVSRNRLAVLPPTLGALVALKSLHIDHNTIGPDLPRECAALTRLEQLVAADNALRLIPPELGVLADRLVVLDLGHNPLVAELPLPLRTRFPVVSPLPNRVEDNLWVGGEEAASNHDALVARRISDVLTLSRSIPPAFPDEFQYTVIPVDDNEDTPLIDHFSQTNAIIAAACAAGRGILVHCRAGQSRSIAVVAAYLMHAHRISHDEALARARAARPIADPNAAFVEQLVAYEHYLTREADVGRATVSEVTHLSKI